jgi:hypothetical protein
VLSIQIQYKLYFYLHIKSKALHTDTSGTNIAIQQARYAYGSSARNVVLIMLRSRQDQRKPEWRT